MSRCILLVNRASGGTQRGLDPHEVCRTVEAIFGKVGHDISSSVSEPGRIEEDLEHAIAVAPDRILVGGGDGTVSAAARRLGGTGIALGILPMGTFNLAARDLGVPLEIEAAARFLATAEVFCIDVLDVSGHSCLCTTILGFYPEYSNVFEKRDHGGHWWKKALKLLTGLRTSFLNSRPLTLSWDGDGGTGAARTKFSAFVPGRYQDSAGLIPARTDFCSGKMTAYIGTHSHPSEALRGILDYMLGRHEQNPGLELVTASHMTLRAARRTSCDVMLDGEILRLQFPIHLRIQPGHLKALSSAQALTVLPPPDK